MEKISTVKKTNAFCPQTLFLYGTYREDGTPNFGLFCWFSYYWDSELGVMACIGGSKLTRDRIHAKKVFSASLVTEDILPLADYLGNTEGHTNKEKCSGIEFTPGQVLAVPILAQSHWTYELEVVQALPMDDGEVLLCKIRNIVAEATHLDEQANKDYQLKRIKPVHTCNGTYYSFAGENLGTWGVPSQVWKRG